MHKKNLCPELLSRAKLLPAKFFKMENKSQKNNSINYTIIKKSNQPNENYFETTNTSIGKDNQIKLKLGN